MALEYVTFDGIVREVAYFFGTALLLVVAGGIIALLLGWRPFDKHQ